MPTSIGKTVYVATAHPATNNADGFEALTWIKATGIQTAPQLGVTHSTISDSDLQSGFIETLKGEATGNATSMMFRTIAGDTGQAAILQQAIDGTGHLSVKIVTGSGVNQAPVADDPVVYAQGICHSYLPKAADASTAEGFEVSFQQNDFTVTDTQPS